MRTKDREWRVFGWAAFLTASAFLVMATGCASVQSYDESVTFVRLTIENHRTVDAIDPHLSLVGTGSHQLGVVKGMGGKLSRLVDTRWFGADGCMTIVAHFAGEGYLAFERFCWRPGYVIEASLYDVFNPAAAWAHP